MVENMPAGSIADLMRSLSWAMPTVPLETLVETEIIQHQIRQQIQLLAQHAQLSLITPSPTVSPPSVTSSPPTVVASTSPSEMVVAPQIGATRKSKGSSTKTSPMPSPSRIISSELNRNTYSDCEKKHFLDVAYENNWGTTVAANKFTRVWGKGPTRRMFYWWREQFKKEHDREQKILDDLRERKTELSIELSQLSQCQESLLGERAERVQICLQQIAVVDSEIANLLAKKHKDFCSITGEVCLHGDGLQEESAIRKFTTPYFCEHCNMPFQKESTCFIHQKLCQTRFVNPITPTSPESPKPTKSEKSLPAVGSPPPLPKLREPVISYATYTTELTELAEHLIARLAECAAVPITTVPSI